MIIDSYNCNDKPDGGSDDHLIRHQMKLQQALGQLVPPTFDGGREVLRWCGRCLSPWREYGRAHVFADLDAEEVMAAYTRLQIEKGYSVLPAGLCPACGYDLGGFPTVEEIVPHPGGYVFSWLRAGFPGQFLCAVMPSPVSHMQQEHMLTWASDVLATAVARAEMRTIATWLRTPSALAGCQPMPLSAHHQQQLQRRHPTVSSLAWRGFLWQEVQAPCGPVLLTLAGTLPPDVVATPDLLHIAWQPFCHIILSYF